MRSISRIGIAMAVAGACGYAAAGTTSVTATSIARESADINTSAVTLTNLNAANALVLGSASVGTGQRLVFSPVGTAEFAATSWSPSFTCETGSNSIVFSLASGASSATSVVYDALTATSGLLGASCRIPSIGFSAASMRTTGNVQLTGAISVVNTGATIDSFSATTVASVGNSFTVSATKLNAVIDVTKSRLTFASGADTGSELIANGHDLLTLTFTPDGTRTEVAGGPINTMSLNVTLTADTGFQFLQEPSTVSGASLNCSADSGSGQASAVAGTATKSTGISLSPASGDCKTMTAAFTNLTWTTTASTVKIALGRSALDATASTSTAFASNVYTAGYSFNKGTLTVSNSSSTIAAGSWTQNGASDLRLNYVPLSDNTSLQVLISNNSSTAGIVEFVAYSGGATCTGNLGAVAANGVTSIGGALRSALRGTPNSSTTTNCTTTFDDATGNAAVLLTTTTPSASTKVHSGFTVTGDTNPRQILINSTN